ncbi:Uma2 family endonuclease [Roseisolibacter sp. H3M3-2]|uniref:Uma2 family endonuclease n=1 Tax=Roseisolibacter sp. H3M3-2 TaxID=3031323 RepID=UPI0023DCAA80|nr:Uma2 family endonuclease [Roseisolibacter sp. H3M3-2]MDF1505812.1 Uma2 family endonuclease [Roseisolibacter sp. H3M3-2]
MATAVKRWTLEEVHSLPDDGNKYELVHGELWVTPAPTNQHETIAARLGHALVPYVEAEGLGLVYRPRAVFRIGQVVEVEPDLMVRQPHPDPRAAWETAPRPSLVVEVLSPSTRRRDLERKRALYVDEAGIPTYWVVDGETRSIIVFTPGATRETADRLVWQPDGAREPLTLDVPALFD